MDTRKIQKRHDEEEEDKEEEDVIPNFEIDDDNGDANGLEYENEMTDFGNLKYNNGGMIFITFFSPSV